MGLRLFVGLALWVAVGQSAGLRLGIAVNNRTNLKPAVIVEAEEIVTEIFERAGVEIIWAECTNTVGVAADFRLNLAPGTAESVGGRKEALAYATMSEDGCRGNLIYDSATCSWGKNTRIRA